MFGGERDRVTKRQLRFIHRIHQVGDSLDMKKSCTRPLAKHKHMRMCEVETQARVTKRSVLSIRRPAIEHLMHLSPIRDVFEDNQVLESQVPVDRQVSLGRRAPPMVLLLLPSAVAANNISSSLRYRFLPQQGVGGRVGGRRARRLLATIISAPCSCSPGRRLHAPHLPFSPPPPLSPSNLLARG